MLYPYNQKQRLTPTGASNVSAPNQPVPQVLHQRVLAPESVARAYRSGALGQFEKEAASERVRVGLGIAVVRDDQVEMCIHIIAPIIYISKVSHFQLEVDANAAPSLVFFYARCGGTSCCKSSEGTGLDMQTALLQAHVRISRIVEGYAAHKSQQIRLDDIVEVISSIVACTQNGSRAGREPACSFSRTRNMCAPEYRAWIEKARRREARRGG